MENQALKTDVVIIGAGPVGLFSIFQCGMLGLKCHVIDSLSEIGGQCTALYPEKPIFDIPAYPEISGEDLISQLERQAEPFAPEYHTNQQVIAVEKIDDGDGFNWCVKTSINTVIKCAAIIVAAGAGAFGPNKPPLQNIESFEGKSVFYAVRNKSIFTNKNVVIAGGGDSAVDWALSLSNIANKIYIVHRRDKFRAMPESLKQLEQAENIEKVVPAQLSSLEGSNGLLNSVVVSDLDGNEKEIEADFLLPFFGLVSALGPIAEWGLNIDNNTVSTDPSTSMTNQENIYAVGDISCYSNKLKLILTGFSESAMAAHEIWRRKNPNSAFHMEYSTTKGVPTK